MSMGPALRCTKDYTLFDLHEFNRPLHGDKRLEESMLKNGFMPSSPMQVMKNGNGKLKIVRGHNRFDIAKRHGLPVWFIEDTSNIDIFDLEAGRQKWNLSDFAHARSQAGDVACTRLLNFSEKHNIPLGMAASLLGGESASSGNQGRAITMGTFTIAADQSHVNAVARIITICRENKIAFAAHASFVKAISMCLRVPAFDGNVFLHKIRLHAANLNKRSTCQSYLDEIEAFYNYSARKALPLAFMAKKAMRSRSGARTQFGSEERKAKGAE